MTTLTGRSDPPAGAPRHDAPEDDGPEDGAPDHDDVVEAVLGTVERLQGVALRTWARIERDHDLSPVHATALEAIGGGARQVSAVADACGRHVSSASRFVDVLVGRRLVDREVDPDDRRAVRLTLTREGRTLLDRIVATHRSALARSLGRLAPDERTELARLMARLADAAEQVADEDAQCR